MVQGRIISEDNSQSKKIGRIGQFSVAITIINVLGLWMISYIDAYYFKSAERGLMSIILLMGSVVVTIGLVVSTVYLFKAVGKKGVFLFCACSSILLCYFSK